MEIDLGELSKETIEDIAHEQLHKFKKEISLYLKHMNLKLIIGNGVLVFNAKLNTINIQHIHQKFFI